MFPGSAWRTVARFARRDLYASRAKCGLLIVAIALSIACVAGVHSAATAARGALLLDSHVWLGGDTSVTTGDALDGNQIAALNRMRASGVDWTLMSWISTSAESDEAPDPALVTVQVVDPAAYPYYGSVGLRPVQSLVAALGLNSVVVSSEVLSRLQARVGDSIRIAGEPFRISALIQSQPDRFTGSLGLGPRCILSMRALEQSGIARSAEVRKYRVLLRLPAGVSIVDAARRLRQIFPEGNILSYRQANRHAIEAVYEATILLQVIALLVLVLGAISVAFVIQQHLNGRLEAFAILKAMGASGSLITAIFVLELVLLLAASLILAAPLFWLVRRAVLDVAGSYFVISPIPILSPQLMVYVALAGCAAVSPALLQVTFQVRALRPAALLRRETGEAGMSASTLPLIAVLPLCIFAILSVMTFETWRQGLFLLLAVCTFTVLTALSARGLIRMLRFRAAEHVLPTRFRISLRALSRPGNRSAAVVTTMAVSFMAMAATFVLQSTIVETMVHLLPLDQANLLLLSLPREHENVVEEFLNRQRGVEAPIQVITLANLRLARIDGVPIESLGEEAQGDAFVSLAGCDRTQAPGTVAVAADVAQLIGAKPGSRLEFAGRRTTLLASVNALPNLNRTEKFWRTFVINCSGLDASEESHQIAVRIHPERQAAVERALAAAYPSLPVLTAAEVSATVDGVSRDIISLLRYVAWFAIATAAVVMIAVVSASRSHRLREIGILSALGAGRATFLTVYTFEFLALGALAGVLGGLAAWGLDSVVFLALLHRSYAALPAVVLLSALVAAMALSLLSGWLPSWRLLGEKPLAILRRE